MCYLYCICIGVTLRKKIRLQGCLDVTFSYIGYLPNINFELSTFSYDSVNNSTNITGNSYFEKSSTNTNLNVGSSLNVDTILSKKMLSNTIQVNNMSCMTININGQIYCETVAFLYINGISLPLQKSNLISNFNIQSKTSFYFTFKNNYRLDIVDVNNNILFSYANTTSDYKYFQQIPYNSNMIKINIYNPLNIII